MNIFTHEQYMQDQLRRARQLRTIGTVLIVVSLFLSFGSFCATSDNPVLGQVMILLSYPFLLIGFPIWTISRGRLRRLGAAPRADNMLNQELRGLNSKYSLHHYPMPGGKLIHHLLITPSGLIAMTSSDAVGPISCNNDRWTSQSGFLDRLTGTKPAIGNPTQEATAAVEAARELLSGIGKPDVPAKGLIVFTRDPDIEMDGCSYPAVPLSEIKQAIKDAQAEMEEAREESKQQGQGVMLTSEDRRRLNALLTPSVIAAPARPAAARR